MKKWINNNGKGSIVATTGFGKTRIALMIMKLVHSKSPETGFLIVVPNEALKNQWEEHIKELGDGISDVADVEIINTVVLYTWNTGILILDEVHRYASEVFSTMFLRVKYNFILGLTATFTRLDGKEKLLSLYCPVIDRITNQDALKNGWISPFVNYEVILEPDDINDYKEITKDFYTHFDYFGYDFKTIMSFVGKNGYIYQNNYVRKIVPDPSGTRSPEIMHKRMAVLTEVKNHTMGFMRSLAKRKRYIYNHPLKREVATMIMEARKDKKIITFSASTKMTRSMKHGTPLTGSGMSAACTKRIIDNFNKEDTGILNTCKKVNEGLDVHGLSVAIIMNTDSSKINAIQKAGRVIRFEEGKLAEIFTLVLNGTSEMSWFENSHRKGSYVQIGMDGLKNVLAGKAYEEYQKPVMKINFRF